jgi:hypothetical protein
MRSINKGWSWPSDPTHVIPIGVLYSKAIFSSNSEDSLPENPLTLTLGQQDKGEGSSSGIETKSSPFLNPKPENNLWEKGPDTNEETEGEESDSTKVSDGSEPAQTTSAPSIFIEESTKATELVRLASRPRMEDTTLELGSSWETKPTNSGTTVEEDDPLDTSGITGKVPIISDGSTHHLNIQLMVLFLTSFFMLDATVMLSFFVLSLSELHQIIKVTKNDSLGQAHLEKNGLISFIIPSNFVLEIWEFRRVLL